MFSTETSVAGHHTCIILYSVYYYFSTNNVGLKKNYFPIRTQLGTNRFSNNLYSDTYFAMVKQLL